MFKLLFCKNSLDEDLHSYEHDLHSGIG